MTGADPGPLPGRFPALLTADPAPLFSTRSMMFSDDTGRDGFVLGVERPEQGILAVDPDRRAPEPLHRRRANAGESGGVIYPDFATLLGEHYRPVTEVVPAVIRSYTIPVDNIPARQLVIHVQEREPVSWINLTINPNYYTTI